MIVDAVKYDTIVSMITTTTTKECTLCKETKQLTDFGTKKKTGKPNSWCKSCVNLRSKEHYRKKNPAAKDMSTYDLRYGKRDDPNYMRKYNWIKNYNLTEERIEEILGRQDNQCWICESVFDDDNIFSVDHDHSCCPGTKSCGECVRGFLCVDCNTGLGKLKDDPEIVRRAIHYLVNNPFYDRRRS
jgi:hypothetical protein